MSTFDAGSIEAKLTLDRSAFQREMREARKEGEDFERESWSAKVAVDTDFEDIRRIKQQLDDLSGSATIDVNLSGMESARRELQNLSGKARVDVEVDGAALDRLKRELNTLSGASVDVDINLRSAYGTLNQLRGQLAAIQDAKINVEINLRSAYGTLAMLRAQLQDLADTTINIDINLRSAYGTLAQLRAQLKSISDETIDVRVNIQNRVLLAGLSKQIKDLNPAVINVDLDIAQAVVKIQILTQLLLTVRQAANINVDVDTAAAMAQLTALRLLLGSLGRTDVDVGVNAFGAGGAASGGIIILLLKVLIALAPIVAAAVAGATAAIVALLGAIVSAAGVLVVFGAAVFGAIQRFKEIEEPLKSANPAVRFLAESLKALSDAWNVFLDATQDDVFLLLGQGARILTEILPRILPIFDALIPVIHDALHAIELFLQSPEGAEMFEYFRTTGVNSLKDILAVVGNLTLFFGRLFDAFAPLTESMTGGLAAITAGWATWAKELKGSEGFEKFINYVRETGPQILDMLGSLIQAFINIGRAVAPLSGPMLDGFTAAFDFIATVDPAIIGAIVVGLAAMVAVMGAVAIIAGVVNAVMLANPFTLIALAIVGLIAAFVYLWKTNEGFRDFIIESWATIQAAFTTTMDALKSAIGVFVQIFQAAWEGIVKGAKWLYDVLLGHSIIPDIVHGITNWIGKIWGFIGPIWNMITNNIATVWGVIKSTIDNAMKVIRGVIDVVMGLIKGDWSRVWDGIKAIIDGVWSQVKNIVGGAIGVIKNMLGGWFGFVTDLMRRLWDGAYNIVNGAWNGLKNLVGGGIGDIVSKLNGWRNSVTGIIRGAWDAAVDIVRNAWSNLRSNIGSGIGDVVSRLYGLQSSITGVFSSAGNWLKDAGRRIIQGLIDAVTGAFGRVRDTFSRLTGMIPDWKGPADRDAVLLRPAGNLIIKGLISGVKDQVPDVEREFQRITSMIGGFSPEITGAIGYSGATQTPAASERSAQEAATNPRSTETLEALLEAIRAQTEALVTGYKRANETAVTLKRQGAAR